MKKLSSNISKALLKEFPFVLYRKPKANFSTALFQTNSDVYIVGDEQEEGFVFAPFNSEHSAYFIPKAFSKEETIEIVDSKKTSQEAYSGDDSSKSHIQLVEKAIDCIEHTEIQKVVISRKEMVAVDNVHVLELYARLVQTYPNAYVYLWFHPKTGLWMGATPERLIHVENSKFQVMALASTQEFKGKLDVKWGRKEQKEHEIVVEYVANRLAEFNIQISETYTVKAGNLLHLRADIKGCIPLDRSVFELISKIHPTPATCGFPKEKAKGFIIANEPYNREYYTGYLGTISKDQADLFVNLRCMKVDLSSKTVAIYVGGGITKDSDAEQEWLETVAKAKVMKRVL